MFWKMLAVGVGGFIGANARYGLALWLGGRSFPWATLLTNVLGCFGLAFFAVWVRGRVTIPEETRLFIATGFFGAFTTFSTFGFETLTLLEEQRPQAALLYVAASLGLGLLGGAVGMGLAQNW